MTRPPCFLASLTTTTMLAAGVILSPLSPPTASAEWTDALPLEEMSAGFRGVVDIAVLRPAGFARLAIGSAVLLPMSTFFNVVGLPFGRDVSVFAQTGTDSSLNRQATPLHGRSGRISKGSEGSAELFGRDV